VLRAYGLELAWISGALLWLVPLYSLIVGTRLRAQLGVGAAAAALSVAGLGALTFLVYVTTPHDLDWHLATSCRRVLFQLWPSIVFLLFLGLATPEERSGGAWGRF